MMPSFDHTKPEPSACDVYVRSRPPKTPNGSKNGSTSRRRMVDSVWMLTTAGPTSCATVTIGVRREAPTVAGIGARSCRGWRASTVCDSAAGLQARLTRKTARRNRSFMPESYEKAFHHRGTKDTKRFLCALCVFVVQMLL